MCWRRASSRHGGSAPAGCFFVSVSVYFTCSAFCVSQRKWRWFPFYFLSCSVFIYFLYCHASDTMAHGIKILHKNWLRYGCVWAPVSARQCVTKVRRIWVPECRKWISKSSAKHEMCIIVFCIQKCNFVFIRYIAKMCFAYDLCSYSQFVYCIFNNKVPACSTCGYLLLLFINI